jgi:hypothetical protein
MQSERPSLAVKTTGNSHLQLCCAHGDGGLRRLFFAGDAFDLIKSLARFRSGGGQQQSLPAVVDWCVRNEIFAILTTKAVGFSKMTTRHWASLK